MNEDFSSTGFSIIKDHDLKQTYSSLKVGDSVDDIFVRHFPGLFNFNQDEMIEAKDINSWEVVTNPEFNSHTLGQIKNPVMIRPIHNLPEEMYTLSKSSVHGGAQTTVFLDKFMSPLRKVKKDIKELYQSDLFNAMEKYGSRFDRSKYGSPRVENYLKENNISSTFATDFSNIEKFMEFVDKKWYRVSSKRNPESVDWLEDFHITIKNEMGGEMRKSVASIGNEELRAEIASLNPLAYEKELMGRDYGILGYETALLGRPTVYDREDYIGYLSKIKQMGSLTIGELYDNSKQNGNKSFVPEMALGYDVDIHDPKSYIPEDLFTDFNPEDLQRLNVFIQDQTSDIYWNAHRRYDDEVYGTIAGELKEFDERFYDYFKRMSPLTDEDKEVIRLKSEGVNNIKPTYDAQLEYISSLEEEAIHKRMGLQLKAFQEDNYHWLLSDDRGFIVESDPGEDRGNTVGDHSDLDDDQQMSMTDKGRKSTDLPESEKREMHRESSRLRESMDKEQDYLDRLRASAFKENPDGTASPIPGRVPRRPTDRYRMAALGDMFGGEEKTFEDMQRVNIDTLIKDLEDEAKMIQRAIGQTSDTNDLFLLEDELSRVKNEIRRVSKNRTSFTLDPDKPFGEALSESFEKMIEAGKNNVILAEEERALAIQERDRLISQKVEEVFELHGLSKQTAQKIREEYKNATSYQDKLNTISKHFSMTNYSQLGDDVDKKLLEGLNSFKSQAQYDVARGFFMLNQYEKEGLTPDHRMDSHMFKFNDFIKNFESFVTSSVTSHNHTLQEQHSKKIKIENSIISATEKVIADNGYIEETMGRTIIEDGNVYQARMSKDDYSEYLNDPKSVADLADRVKSHKKLVEKQRNVSNISTWIDAARKGYTVKSGEGDSIGYKVQLVPNSTTAILTRPAIAIKDLQMGYVNINNSSIVKALETGTLDASPMFAGEGFVVSSQALPRTTGNGHVTIAIDKELDGLFKMKDMKEWQIGKINEDIDAILSGQVQKNNALDESVLEKARELRDELDNLSTDNKPSPQWIVEQLEAKVAEDSIVELSMQAKAEEAERLVTEADARFVESMDQRFPGYEIPADEFERLRVESIERHQKLKAYQEEQHEILQELFDVQEKVEGNKALLGRYQEAIASGVFPDDLTYDGKYDGGDNGQPRAKRLGEIKKELFDMQHASFDAKQIEDQQEMVRKMFLLGENPVEVINGSKYDSFRMSREDFIEELLIDPKNTDTKKPLSKFAKSFIDSHLTHLPPDEHGGVAAAMLDTFDNIIADGVEIDVTTKGLTNQYIMSLDPAAKTRDDLTPEQRTALDARVESLKNKSNLERLQEVLFGHYNKRAVKEVYQSDTEHLKGYENTVRTIRDEIKLKYSSQDITGELFYRMIRNKDSLLSEELVASTIHDMMDLSADDLDIILGNLVETSATEKINLLPDDINLFKDYNNTHDGDIPEDIASGVTDWTHLTEEKRNYEVGEARERALRTKRAWEAAQDAMLDEDGNLVLPHKEATAWVNKHEKKFSKANKTYVNVQKRWNALEQITPWLEADLTDVLTQEDKNGKLKELGTTRLELLQGHADGIFHTLNNNVVWKSLTKGDNRLYRDIHNVLEELSFDISRMKGNKLSEKTVRKIEQYDGLAKFAIASSISPERAHFEFMSIDFLNKYLPNRANLVNDFLLDDPNERVLEQVVKMSEAEGKDFKVNIKVPGTDTYVPAQLRMTDDGLMEAYSSQLEQGFIVNDKGIGRTATVDTESSRAWTRNNKVHSLQSMSAPRPALRTSFGMYKEIKRQGEFTNISNVTGTVLDMLQLIKDGSTAVAYDIETTLTGAKHFKDAIQPIEIFGEKLQFNKDGSVKRDALGNSIIDTYRPQEVHLDDGRIELRDMPTKVNAEFHAIIGLNDQAKTLLFGLGMTEDPLLVRVAGKDGSTGTKKIHVADIAEKLNWRSGMTQKEQLDFNKAKVEFIHSLGSDINFDELAKNVDKGMETLHFLSNIAKYSMSETDRGNKSVIPDGTFQMDYKTKDGKSMSAFEVHSKTRLIPTHEEIINSIMKTPGNAVGLSDKRFDMMFERKDGSYIRKNPNSAIEANYVLQVQRKYTQSLIEQANQGATNLATEKQAKKMFGNNIFYFSSEGKALSAFHNFLDTDDVKVILGVNPEKADNLTLSERTKGDHHVLFDGLQEEEEAFDKALKKLQGERNKVLTDALGGITEEYAGKFAVNPKTAEKLERELKEAANEGRNIPGILNDKSKIWVSNLTQALEYLPELNNSNNQLSIKSEDIAVVDNRIQEITHAIESIMNRGADINDMDSIIYEEFDVFDSRNYSIDDRLIDQVGPVQKLEQKLRSLGIVDQQVLSKFLYPERSSQSAESIMDARKVDAKSAHAGKFDVKENINVTEEFSKAASTVMSGGTSEFEGVNSLVHHMGVDDSVGNISDEKRYREGDFVLLREAYDEDKNSTKATRDKNRNASGQVGVYKITQVDDNLKGFTLQRQLQGAEEIIDDTSVKPLRFEGLTNADFDAKVAQKLEFLSDKNDKVVKKAITGYNNDITREHFERMLRSPNSYYGQINQVNMVESTFNENPLFSLNRDFKFAETKIATGDLIDMSNDRGYVPIGETPLEKARNYYSGLNSIFNQEVFNLRKGAKLGQFEFDLGGEVIQLPTNDPSSPQSERTLKMFGRNVGYEILTNKDGDTAVPQIKLNPQGEWKKGHMSRQEQLISDAITKNMSHLVGGDRFYSTEVSKEHLDALAEIKRFNNTELGKVTNTLMNNVATLRTIDEIDRDGSAHILQSWNDMLKEEAEKVDATRKIDGLSKIENIMVMNANTKELEPVDAIIDHTTPRRAVDSLTKLANRISNISKVDIPGNENKVAAITTNKILPELIKQKLLPEDFNSKSKVLSLETVAEGIMNHVQTNGSPNPLKVVDYVDLAEKFDMEGSELPGKIQEFFDSHINSRVDDLTTGKQKAFSQSSELLDIIVNRGMYLSGMNVGVGDFNAKGIRTIKELSSPSLLSKKSVDQLVGIADEQAGHTTPEALEITKMVYKELGERAVGYDAKKNSINPQEIIDSGDMRRIEAAEALNWVQSYKSPIKGKKAYAPVEDVTEHRMIYGPLAGAKFKDADHGTLEYLVDKHDPSKKVYNAYQQQAQQMYDWKHKESWYPLDMQPKPTYGAARGEAPRDSQQHAEVLNEQHEQTKLDAANTERPVHTPSAPSRQQSIFETPGYDYEKLRNVGADGKPLMNVSNPTVEPASPKVNPEDIEAPKPERSSDLERIVGNTKDEIRDKMKSFLQGESGGKWVAGLGVAAAALFAVNSINGPLRLENRPNGHGVKGITGTPEDDTERGQRRETPSYQGDTADKAYVNAGDKGYTIQAKGRANSSLDSEQLHSSVNNGMGGASSVNINIRDDRSTLDNKWLEDQFSNYINRGQVGDY